MQSSDYNQELGRQFKSGKHEALEAVFNKYYRSLWQFANSLIHDRWAAEDIIVDAFIKLWKCRENFDAEENIKAFLYIATRNACFNFLRHIEVQRHSHKELMYLNGESTENLEDIIDCKIIESEILGELVQEIKSLPPKMAAICEMMFVDGLSTSEISKKLKLSSATIRVQKARAISKMKLALAKKRLLPSLIFLLLQKTIIDWFCR